MHSEQLLIHARSRLVHYVGSKQGTLSSVHWRPYAGRLLVTQSAMQAMRGTLLHQGVRLQPPK